MQVRRAPRRSIRRPVTMVSAAAGKPPIEVTPRQVAIGKAIGAALGAVPVAFLLLAFHSNMGSASGQAATAAPPLVPDRAAEEIERVKAEAQANARDKAGVFFSSCTEAVSGDASVRHYRELSYRDGKVRETRSDDCGGV